jgi:ribonuclease T2
VDTLYGLGPNSYFSKSSYVMHNWTSRYWGQAVYEQLLAIKKAHNPGDRFWCHHYVGDDPEDAYRDPLGAAAGAV